MTTDSSPVRAPWRFFMVEVRAVRRLSPTFVRVTFAGPDLVDFADNGYDQRVKLVLPVDGRGLTDLSTRPEWYTRWRALPDDRRPVVRTYTVRAVRPRQAELDFDIALHGEAGPASRWAATVRPGDAVAVLGPDAGYPGDHGGVEFRLPDQGSSLLLGGDETAVPAIMSILERLPPDVRGDAVLEVPDARDRLDVDAPAGMRVRWFGRDTRPYGVHLIPTVKEIVANLGTPGSTAQTAPPLVDVDVDRDVLWEVPNDLGAPGAPRPDIYAWLAGEAGVIRNLRRHLIGERGLDRRSVAVMGYWRLGRSDDD